MLHCTECYTAQTVQSVERPFNLLKDTTEVLVAAKYLAGRPCIVTVAPARVSYLHFMFDRHQIVLADGCWTESFPLGDLTLQGMADAQRAKIFAPFPDLATDAGANSYEPTRRTLKH